MCVTSTSSRSDPAFSVTPATFFLAFLFNTGIPLAFRSLISSRTLKHLKNAVLVFRYPSCNFPHVSLYFRARFPALASHSCSKGSRPRAVGEYESCLLRHPGRALDLKTKDLIGYLWTSSFIDQSFCFLYYLFCIQLPLFCTVLRKNGTVLSKSESSNFFTYIISSVTVTALNSTSFVLSKKAQCPKPQICTVWLISAKSFCWSTLSFCMLKTFSKMASL